MFLLQLVYFSGILSLYDIPLGPLRIIGLWFNQMIQYLINFLVNLSNDGANLNRARIQCGSKVAR